MNSTTPSSWSMKSDAEMSRRILIVDWPTPQKSKEFKPFSPTAQTLSEIHAVIHLTRQWLSSLHNARNLVRPLSKLCLNCHKGRRQTVVVKIPLFVGGNFLLRIHWYRKIINQFQKWIFFQIPSKLLSVCTESQLDSLSLATLRYGQKTQIKHFFLFLRVLKASGSNGSQNKK